jgi:hypothetical protein
MQTRNKFQRVSNPAPPIVTFRLFASGIVPNSDVSGLDSSTINFQCVSLLEIVSHYDLRFELHYVRS